MLHCGLYAIQLRRRIFQCAGCAVSGGSPQRLRCGAPLLVSADACEAWYRTRDAEGARSSGHAVGGAAKACAADCHGRGVCDRQTGVCACEAGYNGSACEGVNLRECNVVTDGCGTRMTCT